MKTDPTHTAHLKGRTAATVPTRQWPVVSKRALGDLQLTGEAPADWNPVVYATAKGYVWIVNAELELRRLTRCTNEAVAERAKETLINLALIRDRWPIELV